MNQKIQKYINQRILFPKFIEDPIQATCAVIVVIPCFDEKWLDVREVLISLLESASQIQQSVEVILVINHHINTTAEIKDKHASLAVEVQRFISKLDDAKLNIRLIEIEFESLKKAGVGYARKVGMDEAVRRYLSIGKLDGIIANVDADSPVSRNYFSALINAFEQLHAQALSIAFEHSIVEGSSEMQHKAIIQYELHLRYFINMQRRLKLPYAFQTFGSAFAVRVDEYIKEGGMVKRQAGEDFYFLHKYTRKHRLSELNDCAVFPSSRPSSRVPFGTGKAVQDMMDQGVLNKTYHPACFDTLNSTEDLILDYFAHDTLNMDGLNPHFYHYFISNQGLEVLRQFRKQSKNVVDFLTRFYSWFDAFKLMKYLHAIEDVYPKVQVEVGIKFLFDALDLPFENDPYLNLITLRTFDKSQNYVWQYLKVD